MILVLAQQVKDTPAERTYQLRLVGTSLSALGLALIVFGLLRSGAWGFMRPCARRAALDYDLAGDLADPRRRRSPDLSCGGKAGASREVRAR